MSTDLSSIILNNGLNVSEMSELLARATSGVSDGALNSEFQEALSEATSQITKLNSENSQVTEARELITALDKSILGTVASSVDMSELSEDLLKSTGKDSVVEQLMQGHMNAIVTTKPDDDDDGFDYAEAVAGTMKLNNDSEDISHSLEESLEEIVERLGAITAQI